MTNALNQQVSNVLNAVTSNQAGNAAPVIMIFMQGGEGAGQAVSAVPSGPQSAVPVNEAVVPQSSHPKPAKRFPRWARSFCGSIGLGLCTEMIVDALS